MFSNCLIFSIFSAVGNAISMATVNSIDMMMGSKSLCTVNMKRIADHRKDILRDNLENVLRLISEGLLKVKVTLEFDWSQIGEAQKKMEERQTTGKVVLVIPENPVDSGNAVAAAPDEHQIVPDDHHDHHPHEVAAAAAAAAPVDEVKVVPPNVEEAVVASDHPEPPGEAHSHSHDDQKESHGE